MDFPTTPPTASPIVDPVKPSFFAPEHLKRLAKQMIKFVIVGGINTGIDFAVFNGLISVTGINSGFGLVVINTVSFAVAVTNSYFMNKRWTFEDKAAANTPKEAVKFSTFLIVSILGAGVNSGVVFALTTLVAAPFALSPTLWANAAKLVATGFSMAWNFVGYKLFVFRGR